MKIVKEFEDREFLARAYNWVSAEELCQEHFYWGLGEDGELHCSCTRFGDPHLWYPPSYVSNFQLLVSLKLMKRIVKEFGHLVVFT